MRSSAGSLPEAPRVGAVIVAGGAGRRFGGDVRKQYLDLLGRPVLEWAVRAFIQHASVHAVVVVLPTEDAAEPPVWLRALDVHVVAGGEERGDSVWNGLQALGEHVEVALVHDGARPFVSAEVIERVARAAGEAGAVAGVPVADTIKETDAEGRIRATPDRSRLWHAQTPQGFPRARLMEAYRRARAEGIRATDDAALFERLGEPVRMVMGDPANIKVTHPADFAIAEALARCLP